MAHLSIRVLGPLQVSVNGEGVSGFASDKVRALLVYLSLSPGRPHSRETLAGLLWPEFPERSARTNLRNALANLRLTIGDRVASPPFLHITRQSIQFNGQSDHWLDADAFEDLLALVPFTSERLEGAVGLVRGILVEGFSLADSAPFEEWLLLRRERVGRQLIEALHSLVAIYEEQGAYEQALVHARRRTELEPWQEEGQRLLMRVLARSGQRSEALARYEVLCRSLQEDLGAQPSAETKALMEAILAGDLAPEPAQRPSPVAPIWNLPAPPTPFFGRADELAVLEAKLADPDTRLVTLTGMGGSGKTRLALEAGSRLAGRDRRALADALPLTFPHGVVFVPLAAVDTIEGLAPALADALQVRLEKGKGQLLEFLRSKRLLLVLDNLEQLLDGAGLLAKILLAAPGVKIVATSRERLQVRGEHVLQLGGLAYPEHSLEHSLPEADELTAYLAEYPALQLLAESVRRLRPDFSPGSADLPAMLGVCRLVDGLPLALELAASWADALSLNEIFVEARRSLDFWQVDWPDLPERQRNIRAMFDVSWRRLDPAEQTTFSSLTVFRGGFGREAAGEVVTGVEGIPRLLAALVRKSFLQYDQALARYAIHELLRQYGSEKLVQEPACESGVRDRHSAYYTRALSKWEAALFGSWQQTALSEMEIESGNIRVGWYWAVEQAQVERLDGALEALEFFYWHSGRYLEGEAALETAALVATSRAAETSADRTTSLRTALRAMTWQSNFCRALGQRDKDRLLQQQCLTILEDPALAGQDTRLERAILSWTMAVSVCMDDYERGMLGFKESYSLFREIGLQWGMAWALNSWGAMSMFLGAYQEAKGRCQEALALNRSLGNHTGVGVSLRRLAQIAWLEGRFEAAELLAREAHAASLEGNPTDPAFSLLNLGEALEKRGKFLEAHSVTQRSLVLLSNIGHRGYITQANSFLGSYDMHLGRCEEARDHAETGLAMAREHGPRYCIGLSQLVLGCLDLAREVPANAIQSLLDGVAVYRDLGQQDDLSRALASLAYAALGLGETREATRHLYDAYQIATDLGATPPLLWALPATALLLADQSDPERAVELYALASRYPFVAESRWFADVAGDQLAAVAASLPAERVAVLRERGQARDLEVTAAELLAELRR